MLYEAKNWDVRFDGSHKLDVMKVKCLRNMSSVTGMDRSRKEELRRGTGVG